MADVKQCELYVVRYVPNVVKGEFVNIGVVLLETGGDPGGFTGVRFTRDWRRLRCMHADADVELLEALEEELSAKLQSWAPEVIHYKGAMPRREWLLREMEQSFSGALQLAAMNAVRTESPQAEMGVLSRIYVEADPQGAKASAVRRGRPYLYGAMRDAFEHWGVWPLMEKDIRAEPYTRPGDPFKVDCGYKPNGVLHLFHAVSLAGESAVTSRVNTAKAIALSYLELNEGLKEKRGVMSTFTAIVEDGLGEGDPGIGVALATLREREIQIAEVSEMPAIAERARVELRL